MGEEKFEVTNNKKNNPIFIILFITGILFCIYFFSNNTKGNIKTLDIHDSPTVTKKQEKKEDLSITKKRFDYYNEVFSSLHKLQEEYKQTYVKFGMVDLEQANKIPENADFPKYGAIMRKITPIYQSLPKFNTNMSPGEQYLIFKTATYGSSLIFMTPEKDNIEGLNYVLESEKTLKDALENVKNFNKF